MCLQRKKVHGVLRGAVRSVSKRLAVHCIATPVLPLQRVFPQTMRPKQDRKLHSGLRQGQATRLSARRPAQRPATDWGRHTATPDALKTGRCKQTFTDFNVLPTQYDREKQNWRLLQRDAPFGAPPGPASLGAAHCHPRWKTGSCKQTFTCQHNQRKKIWRLRQGPTRLSARRPGPASGKASGAAHCRPQCIENWALQANIHRF